MEHNIRMPQWDHFVLDATLLDNQIAGRVLLALRQNCGGTTSCPDDPDARIASISRSEFRAVQGGTLPLQINASGSGSAEQTKSYDIDIIRNLFVLDTTGSQPDFYIGFEIGTAGSEVKRVRMIQNVADLSHFDSSTAGNNALAKQGEGVDYAVIGNVGSCTTTCTHTFRIYNGAMATGNNVVKNNALYENGAGTCDLFPSYAEDTANNKCFTADPFDRTAGDPPSGNSFTIPDVLITSSNTVLKNIGVVTAYPTDIEVEAVPQSSDYDSGVDDE
jgi:hypothetical protein